MKHEFNTILKGACWVRYWRQRQQLNARVRRVRWPWQSRSYGVRASEPTAPKGIYVECRECGECGHAGINDSHPTDAACNTCNWRGPSPKEDHCPGCGEDGTMTSACPKCGCGRYTLIADATVGALVDRDQTKPRETP